MAALTLFALTAVVFLVLDIIGLKFLLQPLFSQYLGDLLLERFRLAPAAAFYIFFVFALVWFVSWPAARAGSSMQALWNGALLGLMCYATYEFTNYATLNVWHWRLVLVDCFWGSFLTGVSAWLGVYAYLKLFGPPA